MNLLKEEEQMITQIRDHLNKCHPGEGIEWTDDDVIEVAISEGLKNIMRRHELKKEKMK